MAVAAGAKAADSRDAREREARKLCFTGNVERGVEILVDLYGETGHPNYIYNEARCFERNGKYDQAILSYEDYLRKATNLGDVDRGQVEKSIADLRAKLASGPEAGGTAAPPLLTPTLDAGTAAPAATPQDALVAHGGDDAAAADWPWPRKAGVMSLVAAGGGLAIGIAGTVLRQTRGGDFNDVCTYYGGQPQPRIATSGVDCRGKYTSIQAADRMMWIGYVGAGVLAGAGTTLLLLAPRRPAQSSSTLARSCLPALAGTPGVVCAWTF